MKKLGMTMLLVVLAVLAPHAALAADSRCPATGVPVPAGADVQSYLSGNSTGTAFCLSAGMYTPAARLIPRSGQSLYGVPAATVLDGGGTLNFIVDGAGGVKVSNVGLYDLTLQNAVNDVRTWSGWLLDDVTADYAQQVGVTLLGTNAVVQYSTIEYNGLFGVRSNSTVGGAVQYDTIAYNNSPANNPDYSGATHFNIAYGLQVLYNVVHDNQSHGIWFDIGSTQSLVAYNTVYDELDYSYPGIPSPDGDGIRMEISCSNTVLDNTVYGNQGPQIAIDGSDYTTVTGNTVTSPAGHEGIRVAPQDKRKSVPSAASKYCDQTLRTAVQDTVSGNDITLLGHTASVDYDGVHQLSGTSSTVGTTFDEDTYHVFSCGKNLWHWWNGALVKVSFTTFQSKYGQETNGTCQ